MVKFEDEKLIIEIDDPSPGERLLALQQGILKVFANLHFFEDDCAVGAMSSDLSVLAELLEDLLFDPEVILELERQGYFKNQNT